MELPDLRPDGDMRPKIAIEVWRNVIWIGRKLSKSIVNWGHVRLWIRN
jgi:hypothetical protein